MDIDKVDLRILSILQHNANISNVDLAEQVNLSSTPCARRVKQLEQLGYIKKTVAVLDAKLLDLDLLAFVFISMDRHTPERFDQFQSEVVRFPEVLECHLITGQEADYLLKVIVPNMSHYQHFLLGKLTNIEGVTGVHSSFVMRQVISEPTLPLKHLLE